MGGGGRATVPENIQLPLIGSPPQLQSLTYNQRLKLVYFNSTTIPIHRITYNGIYDLPFGRGKHFGRNVSGALDNVIGGWQLATIGTWFSGTWMGVNTGLVQTGSTRIPANKRPTLTLNIQGSTALYREWFAGNYNYANAKAVSGTLVAPAVRQAGPNCSGAFNGQLAVTLSDGSCYNAPFSGIYNTDPRANIIGPGGWNDDFSLYKHFKIGERLDMRFAGDFFNFFNHPVDNPPNTSNGLQDLRSQAAAFPSRQIQLSLRLQF